MILGKGVFIVGLIAQIVIRYPYRNGAKQNTQDRQEQFGLILLGIGSFLLPLMFIFTDWLAFANYNSSLWLMGLGTIVMIVALWLFWRAHADLGNNWSSTLEIHDSHTLITQGVYHNIRHPMYSAGWLIMIADALLLTNWLAGFGGLLAFAFLYFFRVPKEEQMMLQQFGDQYQQYMSRTGRILPKRG